VPANLGQVGSCFMATRRAFMKGGAMALVGTSVVPAFLQRSVLAQTTSAQAQGKKLVVIFQRGAADGLNIVVPYAERNYYQFRPTIAIPQNQLIDLDGFFGLHPAMQSFKPLFDQGHLAMVQACGSPDTTRSHFDAQDFMESGTPGVKASPPAKPHRLPCRRPGVAGSAHAGWEDSRGRDQPGAGFRGRRKESECGPNKLRF
jgi:uncharacterized protein (DUF1501 family)